MDRVVVVGRVVVDRVGFGCLLCDWFFVCIWSCCCLLVLWVVWLGWGGF